MTTEIYTDGYTKTNKEIRNLLFAAEMKLPEFQKLDTAKTLFILPVGSQEVHGRHLANNTDMISAELMAESSGKLFAKKHEDWNVILFPLLNIGADQLPLPGSIEISRSVVYKTLVDYGRSLAKWGFKNLVVTNGHGGLMHNLALDDACRTCNRKFGMKLISPGTLVFQDYIYGKKFQEMENVMGRKLSAAEKNSLTDMEHAAGWETSFMLARRPDLVAADYKKYGPTNVQIGPFFKKIGQIIDSIGRKTPVIGKLIERGGVTIDESFRLLKVQYKLYAGQKKQEYSYNGDPSVASADIGKAWDAGVSNDLSLLYESVFVSETKKPNDVVSSYSALIILRHDFIVSLEWALIFAALIATIFVHFKLFS